MGYPKPKSSKMFEKSYKMKPDRNSREIHGELSRGIAESFQLYNYTAAPFDEKLKII